MKTVKIWWAIVFTNNEPVALQTADGYHAPLIYPSRTMARKMLLDIKQKVDQEIKIIKIKISKVK